MCKWKSAKLNQAAIVCNLASCPSLSESNIEFILQQFLIVCTHINSDRQTLKEQQEIFLIRKDKEMMAS